jgi:uncharacterized protein
MILRIFITAFILYILYRIAKRLFLPSGKKVKPLPSGKTNGNIGEDLVEDDFCHTYVPLSEAHRLEVEGKVFYFCSKSCLEQYQNKSNPKRGEE